MCDTVVSVGSEGVFFAKNSDRDVNEAQVLEWVPRATHPAGATVRTTWLSIPQARETHAVLLSRPFWMWGAEIGTNEHGVTIGNEAVFTRDRVPEIGLTGMDLLRLSLERATTAREAVEVIVTLAARHGQGGRCGHESPAFRYFSSFLVADRRTAFVLETTGREHAFEPIHGVYAISNALSLPALRARADRLVGRVARAADRRACTTRGGEGASLASFMRLLRSHGDTALPRYGLLNGAMGGPCMHGGGVVTSSQTVASWVAHLSPAKVEHWVTGTAAPCTAIFKPVSVDAPIELGPSPRDREDASLFWRHERLHRCALRDPERTFPRFVEERDRVEAQWLAEPPDSATAFAEADTLLRAWTDRVGVPVDRRPPWTRRFWRAREARCR